MKTWELLRMVADKMERYPDQPIIWDHIMHWPVGSGRFPFAGGGTELLSQTQAGVNYAVPSERILRGLARGITSLKVKS
jgi:hypothetical protein